MRIVAEKTLAKPCDRRLDRYLATKIAIKKQTEVCLKLLTK
jgi:hypothetical protein